MPFLGGKNRFFLLKAKKGKAKNNKKQTKKKTIKHKTKIRRV